MSTPAPDRFLEREGSSLRWRLEGSGTPLVLLHGWALDLSYWDALVALLAPGFTVLRFDRRGFGLSTGLPDIHRNADDLLALLDAAAIDRAVLLGMSQGARLAIHFTLANPRRTRALVLDGAPAFDAESDLPLDAYRALLQSAGAAALRERLLQHPLMQLHADDPAARLRLSSIVSHYCGHDLLHPMRRGPAPNLAQIAVPTLIVNGADDTPQRRAAARALQAKIRGSARLELGGAGHLALLDDPEGYAAAVRAFCLELPR